MTYLPPNATVEDVMIAIRLETDKIVVCRKLLATSPTQALTMQLQTLLVTRKVLQSGLPPLKLVNEVD